MKIAHISDIHANFGTDFNPKTYTKAVKILNKLDKDFIFISGDLTTEGLLPEYKFAQEKLKEIEGKLVIVPGNHDERNLGFRLFPEFFGDPSFIHTYSDVTFVGLASSEPDKDGGRLGRWRHQLIEEGIKKHSQLTVIGFHHHLIPIPNSGRETNIIEDAGETLDIILQNNVPLVLMGHRHVPYGVKVHNTLLVNAGTFSCNRTRAHFGNTFNYIDLGQNKITVSVFDIQKEKQKTMIEFDTKNCVCKNCFYD